VRKGLLAYVIFGSTLLAVYAAGGFAKWWKTPSFGVHGGGGGSGRTFWGTGSGGGGFRGGK
jgi:hypothetical protein